MSSKPRKEPLSDTNLSNSKRKKTRKKKVFIPPPPPEAPRPEPVPTEAPASLLTLLQNNKKVHNYFLALQANLDADVRKYKERARYYQKLLEEHLQQQQQQHHDDDGGDSDEGRLVAESEEEEEIGPSRKRQHKNLILDNQKKKSKPNADHKNPTEKQKDAPQTVATVNSNINATSRFAKNFPAKTLDEGLPRTIHMSTSIAAVGETDKLIDDSMFDFQSSDDDEEENRAHIHERNEKKTDHNGSKDFGTDDDEPEAETAVDDSMFELRSSDDDDDDNDDDDDDDGANPSTFMTDPADKKKKNAINSTLDKDAKDNWKFLRSIASELLDAYRCLEYLGVELVDEKVCQTKEGKVAESDGMMHSVDGVTSKAKISIDSEKEQDGEEEDFSFLPTASDAVTLRREKMTKQQQGEDKQVANVKQTTVTLDVTMERRSDEDVITDILNAIQCMTRVNVHTHGGLPSEYHAFRVAPHWFPCGDRVSPEFHAKDDDPPLQNHPALLGKICVFRALSVMHCYASTDSLKSVLFGSYKDPWEELCSSLEGNSSIKQAIRVGMMNRKTMVNDLMESLAGEFAGAWAITDRSVRTQIAALIYDESDGNVGDSMSSDKSEEMEIEESERHSMSSKVPHLHLPAGAKSQVRLAFLAERRILAQILVSFYLVRKDPREAFRCICDYILSSAPSLNVEEYPKMQPALSMVVLEGMIVKDTDLVNMLDNVNGPNRSRSEESEIFWFGKAVNRFCNGKMINRFSRKTTALAIHVAGNIWGRRLQSQDSRTTDIARVEWAAYLRLLKSQASWITTDLGPVTASANSIGAAIQLPGALQTYQDHLYKGFQFFFAQNNGDTDDSDFLSTGGSTSLKGFFAGNQNRFALSLALILLGDTEKLEHLVDQTVHRLQASKTKSELTDGNVHVLSIACVEAYRQIQLRQVDVLQMQRSDYFPNDANTRPVARRHKSNALLSALLEYVKAKVQSAKDVPIAVFDPSMVWDISATLLQCCILVSNGEVAYEVFQMLLEYDRVLSNHFHSGGTKTMPRLPKVLLESIGQTLAIPFVRVINLERRKDRWRSFKAQSMESSVLISRGITLADEGRAESAESSALQNTHLLYGGFALDGSHDIEEVTKQAFGSAEGTKQQSSLEAYVSLKWRPHDLKPFDTKATNDEHLLVRISDTERACALSHISTWRGITRSLTLKAEETPWKSSFQHTEHLRRLFLSSGFARGQPLERKNIGMPPALVCVVLEDDAILCDRFAERLDSLLEELPRDFHFCSLGYGRPATAPLVKFSSQLCVPTCIWYLTGYVVSLEGAEHLLGSLPVRGPVDSWIGLKMCANWDNSFGESVGVGVQSKPKVEGPSRKDFATIMKFRAFAACDPLCSQKVMNAGRSATTNAAGRNWRQRDTDITYSGSENYIG